MPKSPIEFWFDFSSGYAYFAATTIDQLAARHDRDVLWRPYMLGVAFKHTGVRGLSSTPMKGDYARHDWARLSRQTGLPFSPPANHPITALPASRAYYWVEEHVPMKAHDFARAAFNAYFAEARDMTEPANVAAVGAVIGLPQGDLEAGITSDIMKAKVKAVSNEAIDKGIFGSPFFIVDAEPFWGWDRMEMLESWLETGGGDGAGFPPMETLLLPSPPRKRGSRKRPQIQSEADADWIPAYAGMTAGVLQVQPEKDMEVRFWYPNIRFADDSFL